MGLFDFFKPKKVQVDAPKQIVWNPEPSGFDKFAGQVFGLRNGCWVSVNGQTGILVNLYSNGTCRIMLTDSEGNNKVDVMAEAINVRLAKAADIPAKRVAHLTLEDLNRMGYY